VSQFSLRIIGIILTIAALVTGSVVAQSKAESSPIDWRNALRQKPEWYESPEALRIADNLLLHQRDTGGWAKNIDMATVLTDTEKSELTKQKRETDSTIDNGATYTQLEFLARVYTAKKQDRHKDTFLKGIDYLLKAQYATGGWPQYYPLMKGYYTHITFNDDAMIGVMSLLRDIAQNKSPYTFVDKDRRTRAATAVQKGIECILKTQVKANGKLTVWCAQHDEVTLLPAPARTYELVSLSGSESVGVVRFLMGIDHPDARIITSIESAVAWFQASRIMGIRYIKRPDPAKPSALERVVVKDPNAGPIWGRFYEIDTNRPFFSGRDGIKKYDVSEIEAERRNGYNWYTDSPAKLLNDDYPVWKKKWHP